MSRPDPHDPHDPHLDPRDDPHDPAQRRFDRPLHGVERPKVTPVLAVVGLLVVIALVFAVLTLLRYAT